VVASLAIECDGGRGTGSRRHWSIGAIEKKYHIRLSTSTAPSCLCGV